MARSTHEHLGSVLVVVGWGKRSWWGGRGGVVLRSVHQKRTAWQSMQNNGRGEGRRTAVGEVAWVGEGQKSAGGTQQ